MTPQTPDDFSEDPKEASRRAIANAERFFQEADEEEDAELVGDGLPFTPWGLTRIGVKWCFWLGVLSGSMESVVLAMSSKLPLSLMQFGLLGILSSVWTGLLGAGIAAVVGWPLHRLLRTRRPSHRASIHFSLVGMLLFGLYFWVMSISLLLEQRYPAAVLLSLMPLLVGVVLWLNALPRMRRVEMGRPGSVSWSFAALGLTVFVFACSVAGWGLRAQGGRGGLDSDPNVVLLTMEGMGVKRLKAGASAYPALSRLMEQSVQFENAVSASPFTLPNHATLFSGLHPLRHQAFSNQDTLSNTIETLPRVMEAEGFSAAAFVSSSFLKTRHGLSIGYHVYDDDVSDPVPGFSSLMWVHAGKLIGSMFGVWDDTQEQGVRSPEQMADRFVNWVSSHSGSSFLAWVHLGDLTRAHEDSVAPEARLAAAVEKLEGALKETGNWENTLFILVSTRGHLEQNHGPYTGDQSLFDPVVCVPLWMRFPNNEWAGTVIQDQVRLQDVYPTILRRLDLTAVTEMEGQALNEYIDGRLNGSMWTTLMGLDANGQPQLLGLRHQGIKYIETIDGEKEWLYSLTDDPGETKDLSAEQPELVKQVRAILEEDRKTFHERGK